jgi:predicted transcriptional regulator
MRSRGRVAESGANNTGKATQGKENAGVYGVADQDVTEVVRVMEEHQIQRLMVMNCGMRLVRFLCL